MNQEKSSDHLDDSHKYSLVPTINTLNAIFNLVNSVIGAGIVTLPISFYRGGVAFGILSILICSVIICYTSDLMVLSALVLKKKGKKEPRSYGELCKGTFGNWMYYIMCTITFLMMFLAMCVYMVLLRRESQSIISDIRKEYFYHEKYVLLGIAMVLIFPLCMLKKINFLGFTSVLSIISVLVIVISVFVRAPVYHKLMLHMNKDSIKTYISNLKMDKSVWFCKNAKKLKSTSNIHKTFFEELIKSKSCVKEAENIIQKQTDIESLNNIYVDYVYENYGLNESSLKKKKKLTILDILSVLGIYASAFICQQCTFSIFESLKRRTLKESRVVLVISYIIIFILCVAFAIVGYKNQLYLVGDSVFDKMKMRFYKKDAGIDWLTNAGRILLCLTLVFTFPMQNLFMRKNLFQLIHSLYIVRKLKKENPDADISFTEPSNFYFYGISILMFGCTLVVGLFLDSIIDVYSLMGSFFAAPLIYIVPSMCYLRVGNSIWINIMINKKKSKKKFILRTILPLCTLVFGSIILIISAVSQILTMVL